MLKKMLFLLIVSVFFPISTFAAEKARLAIAELDAIGVDKTLARTTSELLRTELFKTGYFSIMERSQMEKLIEEQKFHIGGATAEEDIIKIGQLLVVQYFVVGSINRLGAVYLINIRLVNVEKGKFVAADTIEVKSEEEIPGAVRSLARKITDLTPIRGKVVRVRGNEVLISLGTQDRLETGTMFRVQRLGETFTDPSTGRVIGREVVEVAVLRLAKIISEELSSAFIMEAYGNIEVGDIVVVWVGAPAFQEKPQPIAKPLPEPSVPPVLTQEVKVQQRVEVRDFIFELNECRISGQTLTCLLIVANNTPRQRELLVSAEHTTVVDDSNKKYKKEYCASYTKLGNKEGRWHVSSMFTPNTPVELMLKFERVALQGGEIPILLDIACNSMGNFRVQFRGIPLQGN